MLRSFIAIQIPTEIQITIIRETTNLRQLLEKPLIRWVPQENIHLTLKFLGDVSPTNMESLAHHLTPELAQIPVFDISVRGLGIYPNPRRPRVLWVGAEAPKELTAVARTIESVASRFGFTPEERAFSPHLTIGRVNQRASGNDLQQIRTGLEHTDVGYLGTTTVFGIDIFRSDLRPSGAVYTILHTIPLSNH
jgi:2'-5' RNA ligase